MSKQVVEVVYGRHYRYDVVRSSSFFSTHYYVRRDDGRLSGTFSALNRAVQWAQQHART